tara:strand:+ start:392 stop:910 length:519 start_codon:yes stop_codon:yes gene_type:complete
LLKIKQPIVGRPVKRKPSIDVKAHVTHTINTLLLLRDPHKPEDEQELNGFSYQHLFSADGPYSILFTADSILAVIMWEEGSTISDITLHEAAFKPCSWRYDGSECVSNEYEVANAICDAVDVGTIRPRAGLPRFYPSRNLATGKAKSYKIEGDVLCIGLAKGRGKRRIDFVF